MKKILILIVLCLVATLSLAGCTSNVNQVQTVPTTSTPSALVQGTISTDKVTDNAVVTSSGDKSQSSATGNDDAKFMETIKTQMESIQTQGEQFIAKYSAKDVTGAQAALTQIQADVISKKSEVMAMKVSPRFQTVQQDYGKAIDSLQVIIDNEQKAITYLMNNQQAESDAAIAKSNAATKEFETNINTLSASLLKSTVS